MFDRKTDSLFPLAAKVLGAIFIVMGLVALFQAPIIGAVVLSIGLFAVFAKTGIIIDFTNKRYKNYVGLFGLKFGGWEILPDLKMISVTPHTQVYSNNLPMGGAQSYSKEHSFRVNLKGVNTRISIVASNGKKEEVLNDAEYLAVRLNLDILDCTGKEKILIKITEEIKNKYLQDQYEE